MRQISHKIGVFMDPNFYAVACSQRPGKSLRSWWFQRGRLGICCIACLDSGDNLQAGPSDSKPLPLNGEYRSKYPGHTGFSQHEACKIVWGIQIHTNFTQKYSPESPSFAGLSTLSGGLLLGVTTLGPSLLFLLMQVTFAAGAKLLFLKASWRGIIISAVYFIFQ